MADRDDVVQRQDMEEGQHIGFGRTDEGGDAMRLSVRQRLHPHDRAHIDLTQDEYTPEEVARLISTTLENVMHDIRTGELKAERAGRDVICVKRADLIDWLKRRGGV